MSDIRRYDLAFNVPPEVNTFREHLQILTDMGICQIGIDLQTVKDGKLTPQGHVNWDGWRDATLIDRISQAIQEYEMQVISVHTPIGLCWPDGNHLDQAIEDNFTVIDQAAAWNCSSTVWHFNWFRGNAGPSKDDNWANPETINDIPVDRIETLMADVLPAVCEYGQKRDVWINLENLPLLSWGRDSLHILEFIRKRNLPNLGFTLDTGHSHASGEDVAAVIRQAGPLLRDTHIHDSIGPRGFDFSKPRRNTDGGRDLHAVPGIGTINWPMAVLALWEIDFPRPIFFENPEIQGHPDKSIEQWARNVAQTIRNWRMFEEAAAYWPDPPL